MITVLSMIETSGLPQVKISILGVYIAEIVASMSIRYLDKGYILTVSMDFGKVRV